MGWHDGLAAYLPAEVRGSEGLRVLDEHLLLRLCICSLACHHGHSVSCLQPLPLRGFDEEVRKFVAEQYKVAGLNIHATYSPSKIVKGPDGKLTLHAESKQGEKLALEGLDHVLMATGRAPNTRNLGLEEVSATAICDVDTRQAQTACSEQIGVCESAGEKAGPWGAYKVAACTAIVVLSSRPKGISPSGARVSAVVSPAGSSHSYGAFCHV